MLCDYKQSFRLRETHNKSELKSQCLVFLVIGTDLRWLAFLRKVGWVNRLDLISIAVNPITCYLMDFTLLHGFNALITLRSELVGQKICAD